LKGNILKITDNIKVMKDDYNELFKKYNSNQQVDINEETEKLLDENLMLNQIKENKEAEIENLLEEKKLMKKDYQNILMQYEDAIREKNELTQEISELKMNNYKLKGDYDKLLNDIVNKMDKDKKNKKNSKNDNANSNISYEDQVKEIKSINNSKIDDGEKISRKKGIFSSMTNEKLISYIMEIERINQTLSNEKNGKDQKIHELTQKNLDLNNLMKVLKDRNIDLEEEAKNLQKKIDNLNMDVQNNEIFRPSIAINSQMRVSRLSKLNTIGINAQKFAGKGNFGGGKKKLEKVK
jgi:chromosome segregation ATPase